MAEQTAVRSSTGPLLVVKNLKTHFALPRTSPWAPQNWVYAVDGVDFTLGKGKTLGLVGESGSGKTTVGRTILKLIPSTAGSVTFDGTELLSLRDKDMRPFRQRMQMIFQDPRGSLDPRMCVEDIVTEPVMSTLPSKQRRKRARELMDQVGLSPRYLKRYPHEFSGGQRQRIGIARALACKPDLIVCDEPVSALDVSIQAQILNLLNDIQEALGLTYLFIAHNLAVVEHFADDLAVMYLGRIVEQAPREKLYRDPQHPYTRSLLASIPNPDPSLRSDRAPLKGETPSPVNPPSGCHFHPRCPIARAECSQAVPRLEAIGTDHLVRCPWTK